MKAFVISQFNYCPLTWMFHNRTLNNKINKLHERALRLVYIFYILLLGSVRVQTVRGFYCIYVVGFN